MTLYIRHALLWSAAAQFACKPRSRGFDSAFTTCRQSSVRRGVDASHCSYHIRLDHDRQSRDLDFTRVPVASRLPEYAYKAPSFSGLIPVMKYFSGLHVVDAHALGICPGCHLVDFPDRSTP